MEEALRQARHVAVFQINGLVVSRLIPHSLPNHHSQEVQL